MSNRAKIVAIPKTTTTTVNFLPTSVAACALWLDAADPAGNGVVPANGATVTTWADKSGNSANGTAAGGAITYNSSAKGLTFNGSYFSLPNNTISPGAAYYTIFCVVKPTIISNYPYLWYAGTGGPAGQAMSLVFYPTGEVENGFWTDFMGIAPAGTVAINNTYLFSSAYNGAVVGRVLYKNGTSVVSGTPTTTKNTQASSSVSIGGSSALTGIYHELIVFNSFLGTSQRQNVESYLAQKWGLTASLPVGHPGLTTSVYTQTVALAVPKQKIRTIPRAAVFTNFVPTSIAGCVMWLDAADLTSMTLSGANVSQWTDKSGSGNSVTQASSGSQPTTGGTLNGLNTLYFTGKTMTYTGISVSAQTVFCIYLNNTFTPYGEPVAVGPFAFFYAAPSNNVGIGRTGVTDEVLANWSTNSLTTSKYTIYGGTVSVSGSTTSVLYFNGTQVASTTVSSSGGSVRYNIGHYASGTTGYLAEVLIYNSVLNQTNRQTIESYLAQKWGLTASLPVGHPGLTTTVYGTVAATVRQKIRVIQAAAVIPIFPYSITSGLLAFFSFNNTLADSQNTITLAATGSVSYAAGRTTNQAIYLANEANISAGTYPSNYLRSTYNLPSVFTVSLWFKPTNTNRGNLFTSYNGFSPSNSPNNVLNIYITGGAVYIAYSHIVNNGAGYSISVGTWYNAIITVNNGSFTLYMNGSQSGNTISSTPYISGFSIGDYPESSSDFYTYAGYLDDYRIYNRVLTGTEIGQIYAGTG